MFLFWLRKHFPKRVDWWLIVLEKIYAINSRSTYCLNSQNSIVNVHQSKSSLFVNRHNANILEDEWPSEYTVSTSLVIIVFNLLMYDIIVHYTDHSGSLQYVCFIYIHINCLVFNFSISMSPSLILKILFSRFFLHQLLFSTSDEEFLFSERGCTLVFYSLWFSSQFSKLSQILFHVWIE